MALPGARQTQILEWLNESQTLGIDELAARLNVSAMTVHRDLNELSRLGQVAKVHGGVMLARRPARALTPAIPACHLCNMAVPDRTLVVIQRDQVEQWSMCCPHCGLLALADMKTPTNTLARDFLYGRMVNAVHATYLLQSDISLCCVPSVLCFASPDDAERFQRGFNGWTATYAEARDYLSRDHAQLGGHS